jgi:uncharacterized protein YkwD
LGEADQAVRVDRSPVVARRTILVAVLVALAAVPAAFARHAAERQTNMQALDAGVLVQLNSIRTAHDLVPLRLNASLTTAAEGHSAQMLADGYFAHGSVDGAPFWKRLTAYSDASDGSWSVGENLLWSSPDIGAARALQLWMASPEHRHNILTARWREIGIAAIHADSAPGIYGGRSVTVITTDFGARS